MAMTRATGLEVYALEWAGALELKRRGHQTVPIFQLFPCATKGARQTMTAIGLEPARWNAWVDTVHQLQRVALVQHTSSCGHLGGQLFPKGSFYWVASQALVIARHFSPLENNIKEARKTTYTY